MVGRQLGRMAGRVARATKPLADKAANSEFVRSMKAEYDKGRHGDEGSSDENTSDEGTSDENISDDAAAVAEAMGRVDWAKVRAATASRSGAVAERMRGMAADVDWKKVQSGAAAVSSALIAAVASGQIPVHGRLAGPVTRAILNDQNLAQRVKVVLDGSGSPPPDFRGVIDTTAHET